MRLFDISPPISERLAVWPGDTPPSREVLLDMKAGANITLSTFRGTVHLGSHADGPNHYGKDAPGIDARPLEDYLGPCRVIRITSRSGGVVGLADLPARIDVERILFRTDSYPDPEAFNTDFTALTPEVVEFLADEGARLIGVDTPSVDRFESKDLPVHATFLKRNVAILEGLVLKDVPEGLYELIALPLKLVGFDASPVRAILRAP